MGAIEQFVNLTFTVTGWLAWSLALLAWRAAHPQSQTARRLMAALLLFYAAASTYIVPFALSRPLVRGFSPLSPTELGAEPVIVVLGSGSPVFRGRDGSEVWFLDAAGAMRVLEAVRLYRLAGGRIIASGGSVGGVYSHATTGGAMRNVLMQLGVPSERILLEAQSQSTRDEAVLVAAMLKESGAPRVVLVTSDYHMMRAASTFRAVGLEVLPAIALDPMTGRGARDLYMPSNNGLLFSASFVRELMALGWYWSRGWLA